MRIGTLVVLALVSCTKAERPTSAHVPPQPDRPSSSINIDVWFHAGASAQSEITRRAFQAFNASHDEIHITPVELPEEGYHEQIRAAIHSAAITVELPCLLEIDGPNTYSYVEQGILVPLDSYISTEMRADFLPSILEQGTYRDGALYTLGQYESGLALWANRRYLAEAGVRTPTLDRPWNGEEFESVLYALSRVDGVLYPLDLKLNYQIGEFFTYAFLPLLQGFGGDLLDDSAKPRAVGVLNGQRSVDAFTTMRGWIDAGYVDRSPGDDRAFIEGEAALSWVGHWAYEPYRDALGEELLLLPAPDFGTGPKTGTGSWGWGITAACTHPEAAWEVLEFILDPEVIARQSDAAGTIPARRSAYEMSELYRPGGELELYLEQLRRGYGVPRPATPLYPEISAVFATTVVRIMGGAAIRPELDHAATLIDVLLERHDEADVPE